MHVMRFTTLLLLVLCFSTRGNSVGKPLNVVLWHGMGDTATAAGTKHICQMIRDEVPDAYVLDVQIGSGSFADRMNTFFMPINKQLEKVCEMIHSDPRLADGFHMVGISQAGLFVRALAQRCPPTRLGSVISIGGPQQGVFGLPFCPFSSSVPLCRYARDLLAKSAYLDPIQANFVQAQYWQDPVNGEVFRRKSQFLAEINQENTVNEAYRQNLLKAENLVLVRFMDDITVIPNISEWFGFYNSGQAEVVYNFTESKQYKTDSLGLRTLHRQGRLHLIPLPGPHLKFSDAWFRSVIIDRYLKTIY